MSGLNSDAVDREFFAGTAIRSNFLCNLGYGDASALFPRLPRLAFEDACEIIRIGRSACLCERITPSHNPNANQHRASRAH